MQTPNAETPHVADSPLTKYAPTESPKDRLLRLGAPSLTDAELLTVLLRSRAAESTTLQRLLEGRGGLQSFAAAASWELSGRPGLGPSRAAVLLAAIELGRRVMRPNNTQPILGSASSVYRYLAPTLQALRHEVFHVLCINSRNRLLLDARIAEGTAFSCPVDPREVFSAAISSGAAAIILAHNHPSGVATPSRQDLDLTRQLLEGGRLLGVKVLDHVIVGNGSYISLEERGLIADLSQKSTSTDNP